MTGKIDGVLELWLNTVFFRSEKDITLSVLNDSTRFYKACIKNI